MSVIYKAVCTDSSPVIHWRTKGSKNGVRVWQNEDGSYTEAGKNYKPGGRYSQADGYSDAEDKTSVANPTANGSKSSTSSSTPDSNGKVQMKTERPSGIDRAAKSRSLSDMSTKPRNGERLTGNALQEAYEACDEIRVKEGGSTFRKNGGLDDVGTNKVRESILETCKGVSGAETIAKEYESNNRLFDQTENKYTKTDVVELGGKMMAIEYTDWFSACDTKAYKDSTLDTMNRQLDASGGELKNVSKMNATDRNLYYTSLTTYMGLSADPDGWTPTTYVETGNLSKEYQRYLDSYYSQSTINSYIATVMYNGGNFDAITYSAYVESTGLKAPKKKYNT